MPFYRHFPIRRSSDSIAAPIQVAAPYTQEELSDPTIKQTISELLGKSLTTWERDFLTSIGQYFDRKLQLTYGQYGSYKKIVDKFSPEKIAEQESFVSSFTDTMRENMKIVASIHRETGSRYYIPLVNSILSDDKFIPTEQQWNSFMNNKYSIGYINNAKSEPKFNIGDTVEPSSLDKSKSWTIGIVIDNVGILPHTHAAGGKRYYILPYGQTKPIHVEERMLKFHR